MPPHLQQLPVHQGCLLLTVPSGRAQRVEDPPVSGQSGLDRSRSLCSQREALGSPLPGLGCHPEVGRDPQKLLRPSGDAALRLVRCVCEGFAALGAAALSSQDSRCVLHQGYAGPWNFQGLS